MNKMKKPKVFVDSSVYINWLNKGAEYECIERVKRLAKENTIEIKISLGIMHEILVGRDCSDAELEKIKNEWPHTYCEKLDPNFIVGDEDGSYKNYLAKCREEWKSLANLIHDTKDSKHFVTADRLGGAEYFLTLDNKFFNKMNNEGQKHSSNVKRMKPCEFVKIFDS